MTDYPFDLPYHSDSDTPCIPALMTRACPEHHVWRVPQGEAETLHAWGTLVNEHGNVSEQADRLALFARCVWDMLPAD